MIEIDKIKQSLPVEVTVSYVAIVSLFKTCSDAEVQTAQSGCVAKGDYASEMLVIMAAFVLINAFYMWRSISRDVWLILNASVGFVLWAIAIDKDRFSSEFSFFSLFNVPASDVFFQLVLPAAIIMQGLVTVMFFGSQNLQRQGSNEK